MAERAEPFGKGLPEQHRRHHCRDIEHDGDEDEDRPHPRQRLHEPRHDPPERRNHRDEAQHAQDPQRSQDRERPGGGKQRDRDDREVEQAPRVAEEAEAVDDEAEGNLDDENGEDRLVEREEQRADRRHDGGRRLETQRDGVEKDDADDRPFPGAGSDDIPYPLAHRRPLV